MKTIYDIVSNGPRDTKWVERHRTAIQRGLYAGPVTNHSEAMVQGINAWIAYAFAHRYRYAAPIGQDYVLGPMWKQWGIGLRGLLNGETGDLDCGTLDTIILDNLKEQFPGEEEFN